MKKHTRGQSLLEAALVLPIVLFLLLGMLDFGRAFYAMVVLYDAADEGATYASIKPSDVNGVRIRAAQASTGLVQIEAARVNVEYPPVIFAGAPISVTVEYDLELFTPVGALFVPDNTIELTGHAAHSIISP